MGPRQSAAASESSTADLQGRPRARGQQAGRSVSCQETQSSCPAARAGSAMHRERTEMGDKGRQCREHRQGEMKQAAYGRRRHGT